MTNQPNFFLGTKMSLALKALLEKLAKRLGLDFPLPVYLAGGMAVHLYTNLRATEDVDAEYGYRVHVPDDITQDIEDPEVGLPEFLYFDKNYNSTFGLMHENYREDSIPVPIGVENIELRILAPVDLAVSKIARLQGPDMGDILELVRMGLVTADEIEARANESLAGYVGNVSMLRLNIRDVVSAARRLENPSDVG